jgi:2,4-dienoyl-CoA reductase-like NADH-dependent reductase (Old Yellow Enzyme family)/thioredoxin reductase
MSAEVPRFPRLFSPLRIGPLQIPNRIVSSGHDTVMVDDGKITDQLIAYHQARAEGGAGLIVVQVAGVHESARYTSHVLIAADDSCLPGYTRLADTVHAYGTVLFGQLFHPGREVMESTDGTAPVAVAPSPVPSERFHVMPRALRVREITEIVEGYGAAAARLVRAGLDGVEIVASHGYLPSQFLNPNVNHRDDQYGSTPDGRLRFLREVASAVRLQAGPGAAVGIRISVAEHDPAGLPEDIAIHACATLASAGLIDYVSVTTGTSATLAGSGHIVPEMHWRAGYTAPAARRMKDAVAVPVLVAGRINQPQEAELILQSGDADACIMTRALICDPTMPALALQGRTDDIRACIACNQACIGHFHAGFPISCIQHPETGRELRYGRRRPAPHARNILVAGGGPAGMKAAAVAAERGHTVVLHEATGRLGGQILLAQRLPGRAEFGGAATNLQRELNRANVKVVFHSPVTPELVHKESPDLVIVATGARPYRPSLEVDGNPVLVDAWEVIQGRELPSGHTVVVDWRGDWTGIGTARILAARGHRVTLAVTGYAAGEHLQQYVRDVNLAALQEAKITVIPLVRPYGADDDTLYLQHVLTESPVIIEGISATVLACGHQAASALLTGLEEQGMPAIGAGDCLAPRSVEEAVLEGLAVASEI